MSTKNRKFELSWTQKQPSVINEEVLLLSKISFTERRTELQKIFALIDKDENLYATISEIW